MWSQALEPADDPLIDVLQDGGVEEHSLPPYGRYLCINDKEVFSGVCESGHKVRYQRASCIRCIALRSAIIVSFLVFV